MGGRDHRTLRGQLADAFHLAEHARDRSACESAPGGIDEDQADAAIAADQAADGDPDTLLARTLELIDAGLLARNRAWWRELVAAHGLAAEPPGEQ